MEASRRKQRVKRTALSLIFECIDANLANSGGTVAYQTALYHWSEMTAEDWSAILAEVERFQNKLIDRQARIGRTRRMNIFRA